MLCKLCSCTPRAGHLEERGEKEGTNVSKEEKGGSDNKINVCSPVPQISAGLPEHCAVQSVSGALSVVSTARMLEI